MFFGWKVVATAFAIATFAWSIGFYGPSVFLNTLHQQHGWPASVISAAITTHYLFSAMLTAHLDSAHRRFGIRWLVALAACVQIIAGIVVVFGHRAIRSREQTDCVTHPGR